MTANAAPTQEFPSWLNSTGNLYFSWTYMSHIPLKLLTSLNEFRIKYKSFTILEFICLTKASRIGFLQSPPPEPMILVMPALWIRVGGIISAILLTMPWHIESVTFPRLQSEAYDQKCLHSFDLQFIKLLTINLKLLRV